MYDRCEVCGDMILCDVFRDVYCDVSHNMHTAEYLGICACVARRWRWRSLDGAPPWQLIS